ncbi:hypothetical protein MNQ96_16255 [Sphingopyxis granuli]|uniref:hypothetical protein n=1 Tax=Sphingopyxis granuli TaxID=267128 RepID=UPI001F53DD37|nr:hypothetical protein [Sphingopyxis granuli]UNK79074.1 hypothetical protein MNQ96_16255 [Sphingopyxis granuli]
MINYHTPRFKTSEVARAAGLNPVTLRAYFARGHFDVPGLDRAEADGDGLPNKFSLRDALLFAVAADLIAAGVSPSAAYRAGLQFAHTGTMDRLPAHLFPKGLTLLIHRPKSGHTKIIKSGVHLDLGKALAAVPEETRDPVIIVDLTNVHSIVRAALNV